MENGEMANSNYYIDEQNTIVQALPTSITRGLCSGDKFRNLRIHQKSGNYIEEEASRALLEPHEHALRMLAAILDELIPVIGLWGDFHFGAIKDLLNTRCTEVSITQEDRPLSESSSIQELTSYMIRMRDIWIRPFRNGERFQFADTGTVRKLETLVPKFSSNDRLHIRKLMYQKKIYPGVTDPEDRITLLELLWNIPGRILSFHTLSYDGRYVLQSCPELLRELLPPFKKKSQATVRGEFFRAHRGARHASEQTATARGYCQLYLFVMRHGAAPRKPKDKVPTRCLDRKWWSRLARFAINLGFRTRQLETLNTEDDSLDADTDSHMSVDGPPEFPTICENLPRTQRCGRPHYEIFEQYRHHLFLDVICADIGMISGPNVTWLTILRDMFVAFFGDLSIFQSTLTSVPTAFEPNPTMDRRAFASSSVYSANATDNNEPVYSVDDSVEFARGRETDLSGPMPEHSRPDTQFDMSTLASRWVAQERATALNQLQGQVEGGAGEQASESAEHRVATESTRPEVRTEAAHVRFDRPDWGSDGSAGTAMSQTDARARPVTRYDFKGLVRLPSIGAESEPALGSHNISITFHIYERNQWKVTNVLSVDPSNSSVLERAVQGYRRQGMLVYDMRMRAVSVSSSFRAATSDGANALLLIPKAVKTNGRPIEPPHAATRLRKRRNR
ncbi:hypothetical protein AJ78_08444 [Emergomyces pasteurianus Ep9510]|uniref:Uncharacterized protein n=1 Tax=Emergomyces pasteurianus Ep9510 TaxID=1447872 RepID=A0A1J9P2I5_9EURO|nr:hypothetical protein AJ78_08444 [Emergomyces pasteurianus Ep9510]